MHAPHYGTGARVQHRRLEGLRPCGQGRVLLGRLDTLPSTTNQAHRTIRRQGAPPLWVKHCPFGITLPSSLSAPLVPPQARRDVKTAQSGDAGQKKALKKAEEQLDAVEVSQGPCTWIEKGLVWSQDKGADGSLGAQLGNVGAKVLQANALSDAAKPARAPSCRASLILLTHPPSPPSNTHHLWPTKPSPLPLPTRPHACPLPPQASLSDLSRKLAGAREELDTDMLAQVSGAPREMRHTKGR